MCLLTRDKLDYLFLDKARCSLITENILNFDKLLPVYNLASSRSAVNDNQLVKCCSMGSFFQYIPINLLYFYI